MSCQPDAEFCSNQEIPNDLLSHVADAICIHTKFAKFKRYNASALGPRTADPAFPMKQLEGCRRETAAIDLWEWDWKTQQRGVGQESCSSDALPTFMLRNKTKQTANYESSLHASVLSWQVSSQLGLTWVAITKSGHLQLQPSSIKLVRMAAHHNELISLISFAS